MKFANARKVNRKSGVRLGERWGTQGLSAGEGLEVEGGGSPGLLVGEGSYRQQD
jgi:hypothetical protein